MMRAVASLVAVLSVTACGDPLRGIEQLSEEELPKQESQLAVLPSEAEVQREGGFLSRIWGQPEDAKPVTEQEAVMVNTDPSAAVASDAEVAQATPVIEAETELDETASAQAAPAKTGTPTKQGGNRLISWLVRQAPKPAQNEEPAVEAKAAAVAPADSITETIAQDVDAPKKAPETAPVELASLDPAPAETVKPKTERRTGLFARRTDGPRKRADTAISPDVAYGSIQAFGSVGRVCEARSKPLGTKVATSEGRGTRYSLYDSAPGSTGQRTFYVTGFEDKCPRQFTAALALFGAPSMHEKLRYGQPAKSYPYSATDEAYEKLKARICGAGRSKPCGPKMDTLERNTVFISVYERFTDNGRWADILVHGGSVLATALKDP